MKFCACIRLVLFKMFSPRGMQFIPRIYRTTKQKSVYSFVKDLRLFRQEVISFGTVFLFSYFNLRNFFPSDRSQQHTSRHSSSEANPTVLKCNCSQVCLHRIAHQNYCHGCTGFTINNASSIPMPKSTSFIINSIITYVKVDVPSRTFLWSTNVSLKVSALKLLAVVVNW